MKNVKFSLVVILQQQAKAGSLKFWLASFLAGRDLNSFN